MLKTFSLRELPDPISSEREAALLTDLHIRLASTIRAGVSQDKNIDALNRIVYDVFGEYGLKCGYVGPYVIMPGKELFSNPLASVGDIIGCTDIPLHKGTIGTLFRLYGEQSLYIPSVLDLERQAPLSHHDCREEEKVESKEEDAKVESREDMSELVIALPKEYEGRSIAQECLDIDVRLVNPFSDFGAARLEFIVVPHLRTIFGTGITYEPTEIIHVRPPEEIKTS